MRHVHTLIRSIAMPCLRSFLLSTLTIRRTPKLSLDPPTTPFRSTDNSSPETSILPLLDPFFFFLNDPAPPEISPLPLHGPLPISGRYGAPSRFARESSVQGPLRFPVRIS